VRGERELALDDERRDEDDPRAAVGGEPAGEVERVLRLLPVEQRHDDAAVGERTGRAREAAGAVAQHMQVGKPHFSSWYGTEARTTFGSKSRRRLR
jgi:hypothetical protein